MENHYCTFFGAFATVYSLSDENGKVFYIGATIMTLDIRLSQHLINAARWDGNRKKNAAIRSLNNKVLINELERVWVTGNKPKSAIYKALPTEIKWIKYFSDKGHEMLNVRGHSKQTTVREQIIAESLGIAS